MPSVDVLIAFTFAALLMNISPGPSNLYVIARSIAQGTLGGLVAAMGLAVGSMVHVIATVLGLSVIFSQSPTVYLIVKLLGAAYLIYLGINYWRASNKGHKQAVKAVTKKPLLSVFYESIVVEVTNPKTALFFIALLPQFVSPEEGPIAMQFLVLGLIVTLSAIPCDILVAVSASKAARWLLSNQRAQQIQERLSGSMLMAMGAYIVADETTSYI